MLGMANQPSSSYEIRICTYHPELGYARGELRYRQPASRYIAPAQSLRYEPEEEEEEVFIQP